LCQPEEESGSAEEQPASNKVDAITIGFEGLIYQPFIHFIG
jgi:hypothetical protein